MRYEFRGGGSNKFWEIFKPIRLNDSYVVDVVFGRIGTSGQPHRKVFLSKWRADTYHDGKVAEKLKKGYHVVGVKPIPAKPFTSLADPKYVAPKPKPCEHVTLTKKGKGWECASCKHQVEFDQPQAVSTPEFETKVRRFFDLRPIA